MKCPKCGTTVKDDAKFCFACGAKLEQPRRYIDRTGQQSDPE